LHSPRGELVVLAAAILAMAIIPILDYSSSWAHVDWDSYALGTRHWLETGQLYGAGQLDGPYQPFVNGGAGFSYPPPAVLLFVPFLSVGYLGWAIANTFVLVSGVIAIASREFNRHSALAAALMLLVLAQSRQYIEGLAVGNVNIALAGLFAWTWAFGRGSKAPAYLAVAGGVVKPFLGALVFFTDRRHLLSSIARAAALAIVVVVVTLPFLGTRPWTEYLTVGGNTQPLCSVSLRPLMCVVQPIAGNATTIVIVAYGLIVAALATIAESELLAFALIVMAMLGVQFELFNHSFLYALIFLFAATSRLAQWLQVRFQRRVVIPA
jgi:hypothetical protein